MSERFFYGRERGRIDEPVHIWRWITEGGAMYSLCGVFANAGSITGRGYSVQARYCAERYCAERYCAERYCAECVRQHASEREATAVGAEGDEK